MTPGPPIAILLAALVLGGCGDGGEAAPDPTGRAGGPAATTHLLHSELDPPRCGAETGCAEASGEIAYIERADPDGDGDAHLVLLSAEGITAPGVSVIDVAAGLRPRPLPRRGDLLAAAGPVYSGSYGQRQIEATAIDVVRVRSGGG